MEKPLQITFKGIESSAYLEDLIRERVERLERFQPRITACRVVVDVPHRSPETGKVPIGLAVEVTVPGRQKIIAKGQEERRETKDDHGALLTRVFDAVQRQLDTDADMQNGAVKPHAADGEAGLVVRLFPEQNYGFIEVKGSPDLYFTRNAVVGGSFEDIEVGVLVHVTRATTEGPMGPEASSVRVLNARRSPA